MRSMSKVVEQVEIGEYTIRRKADGSIAVARKGGRIAVSDMGVTKDSRGFVLVEPK